MIYSGILVQLAVLILIIILLTTVLMTHKIIYAFIDKVYKDMMKHIWYPRCEVMMLLEKTQISIIELKGQNVLPIGIDL